jgi:hypothetical protein
VSDAVGVSDRVKEDHVMARKKASPRRPRRRPPQALQTGPAVATVLQTAIPPPLQLERADPDAIDRKLVELVGAHKRTLVIGHDTWPLSRSLSSQGCRVSVVETRDQGPADSATFPDRVVVGDPDAMDLERTFQGAQFDAIVVVRLLERVRDPVAMLMALGRHLSPDGGIVAVVPNIMHASIRLAFLTGRSPAGLLASGASAPSHWYDRAALEQTFERAGLALTRLERHTEGFDAGETAIDGTLVPRQIVESVMGDADALTSAFVVVAHPLPLAGGVLLQMRVRDIAQRQDLLSEQTQQLAHRADGLDTRCAELQRSVAGAVSTMDRVRADLQALSTRDGGLQSCLATAHQRLMGERVDLEGIERDLKRFQYEQLIRRVRNAVEAAVPKGAVVLVVSKGDDRLLDFRGRTGWHFLGNGKGQYAGHHPADGAAAIEALERMRADGARYLVFPQVALWWLEHYASFTEYLDRCCRVVLRDERTAVIYSLNKAENGR